MTPIDHSPRPARHIAALVFLGASVLGSSAQTPAVPPPATPAPPKPPWQQSASLGFSLTKGNSDVLLFTADYRAARKGTQSEFGLGINASYGEDNGTKNNEQLRAFAQFNWLFNERIYSFSRVEAFHDGIADIEYRYTLSVGAGHYFIKNGKTVLSAEVGPGYTFERVGGVSNDYASLRMGQRYEHKFNDRTRVWQTFEYLPQVTDFANYIVTFEVGLETALSEKISLRLTIRDMYDSQPAPDREENDLRFVTGIAVKF